ncbi:MAG TPA: hypothetical protein VF401_02290 [Candidatus Saccharimonadales bacterium]
MRISPERIKELQKLLKEQTGRDYTDEEAQQAGLAIMQFTLAKEKRKKELDTPKVIDLSKLSATEQKMVELYKDFNQDGTPFSLHVHNPKAPSQYFDLRFADYDKLRLLRYILGDFTTLRVFDQPYEKVNWEVPFYYQGKQCTVMHQKFGFKLILESGLNKKETTKLHDNIVKRLEKGLDLAQEIVREAATKALDQGNIIISNKLRDSRNMYEFFRDQAQTEQTNDGDGICLDDIRKSKKSVEAIVEEMQRLSSAQDKSGYLEQAAYLAYFGMIEHICVLFLPFSKSSHVKDPHAFIRRLAWHQKFKEVLPIADKDFKKLYDYLRELSEHRRNATAHGHFDKLNTNFSFYFKPAKHRIPMSVYDDKVVARWQDMAINFKELDKLLVLLASSPKTKNAYKYIATEFDISFDPASVKQYKSLLGMSDEELDDFIRHESNVRDAHANMDFGMYD